VAEKNYQKRIVKKELSKKNWLEKDLDKADESTEHAGTNRTTQ